MSDSSEVTPKAASEALANGAVLIDVREKSEYDDVRIPGSVLIPLGDLPARLAEVPADRDVYVHCRMGGRSARAVDYLRAMRIPILRGRAFLDSDNESAPLVAIINETMANRFWPGQDPIGERFSRASAAGPFLQVVGIARDARAR